MDEGSNFNRIVHACVNLPIPLVDCSKLAPGLCLWEWAPACGAHPGHPPRSPRPGPRKEWMGYTGAADELAGDFYPAASGEKRQEESRESELKSLSY